MLIQNRSRAVNATFGFDFALDAPSSSNPTTSLDEKDLSIESRVNVGKDDSEPAPAIHEAVIEPVQDIKREEKHKTAAKAAKARRRLPVDCEEAQPPQANKDGDDSFVAQAKSRKGGNRRRKAGPSTEHEDVLPISEGATGTKKHIDQKGEHKTASGPDDTAAPNPRRGTKRKHLALKTPDQAEQESASANKIRVIEQSEESKPTRARRGATNKAAARSRTTRNNTKTTVSNSSTASREGTREPVIAFEKESEDMVAPPAEPSGEPMTPPEATGKRKGNASLSRREPLAEADANQSPEKRGTDNQSKERKPQRTSRRSKKQIAASTKTRGPTQRGRKMYVEPDEHDVCGGDEKADSMEPDAQAQEPAPDMPNRAVKAAKASRKRKADVEIEWEMDEEVEEDQAALKPSTPEPATKAPNAKVGKKNGDKAELKTEIKEESGMRATQPAPSTREAEQPTGITRVGETPQARVSVEQHRNGGDGKKDGSHAPSTPEPVPRAKNARASKQCKRKETIKQDVAGIATAPGTPSPEQKSKAGGLMTGAHRHQEPPESDPPAAGIAHPDVEAQAAVLPTPSPDRPSTANERELSPSPQKRAAPVPAPANTPPHLKAAPVLKKPDEGGKKPKMRIDPETGDPSRRETVRTRKLDSDTGGLKRTLFKKPSAPAAASTILEELDEGEDALVGNRGGQNDEDVDWLFAPIEATRAPCLASNKTATTAGGTKKRKSYSKLGDIDLDDLCSNIASFAKVDKPGLQEKPGSSGRSLTTTSVAPAQTKGGRARRKR